MYESRRFNIGIKHVFSCINIRWVPREVLKTEVAARGFQHRPRIPANVNARKKMFDRYYCIKVEKKSILERYFDVLCWRYFVLIFFLHRRTKIISIYYISSFQGHLFVFCFVLFVLIVV